MILLAAEDTFQLAHLLLVTHNVLPGYWSLAHNLDQSCVVNNSQVLYVINPDKHK